MPVVLTEESAAEEESAVEDVSSFEDESVFDEDELSALSSLLDELELEDVLVQLRLNLSALTFNVANLLLLLTVPSKPHLLYVYFEASVAISDLISPPSKLKP